VNLSVTSNQCGELPTVGVMLEWAELEHDFIEKGLFVSSSRDPHGN
jgi:hypothetical protein